MEFRAVPRPEARCRPTPPPPRPEIEGLRRKLQLYLSPDDPMLQTPWEVSGRRPSAAALGSGLW